MWPRSWPGCGEGDEEHLAAGRQFGGPRRGRGPRPARVRGRRGAGRRRPGQRGPPARAAARLPRAIAVPEVERLIAAAEAGDDPAGLRPLRDRALLELLYGTGARISEAVGLDVDDLAFLVPGEAPVAGRRPVPATVRLSGKGGRHRIVPVGRYAREALDAYLVRARPVLAAGSRRRSASLRPYS